MIDNTVTDVFLIDVQFTKATHCKRAFKSNCILYALSQNKIPYSTPRTTNSILNDT